MSEKLFYRQLIAKAEELLDARMNDVEAILEARRNESATKETKEMKAKGKKRKKRK